jgi:hypothetical protein
MKKRFVFLSDTLFDFRYLCHAEFDKVEHAHGHQKKNCRALPIATMDDKVEDTLKHKITKTPAKFQIATTDKCCPQGTGQKNPSGAQS